MSHHGWTPVSKYTFANRMCERILPVNSIVHLCESDVGKNLCQSWMITTSYVPSSTQGTVDGRFRREELCQWLDYCTSRAQRKSGFEIQRDKLLSGISTSEKFGGWGVVLRLSVEGRREKLGHLLLTNSHRSNCPFAQCQNLNADVPRKRSGVSN